MKTKLLSQIILAVCLLLPLTSYAQTNTNTVPTVNNPIIELLQNTIVDTNSTFFSTTSLEIRALTQTTLTTYESVLSASYSFGTNGNFGVGAEVINGALNVVDSTYLTLEYSVPYHNIKFRPILGVGYDYVNRGASFEFGGGLEVAVSQNMFAVTEALYKVTTHSFKEPP